MEAQGPRPEGTRRAAALLLVLPGALALIALALTPVASGGLTTFAEPGRVVPSVAPPSGGPHDDADDAAVAPVAAPSPTTDAEDKAFSSINFLAPDIDIEPPPPPKPPPGKRYSTSGSLTGLSYTQFCSAAAPSASAASTNVQALLSAVNKERARLGYRSLTWSGGLASDAQSYANTLAARSNDNPGLAPGSSAWYSNVFKHATSLGGANGENLAFSSGGSQSGAVAYAHSGWIRSPGHCRNMMNPSRRSMGAGIAQDDAGAWFVVGRYKN